MIATKIICCEANDITIGCKEPEKGLRDAQAHMSSFSDFPRTSGRHQATALARFVGWYRGHCLETAEARTS